MRLNINKIKIIAICFCFIFGTILLIKINIYAKQYKEIISNNENSIHKLISQLNYKKKIYINIQSSKKIKYKNNKIIKFINDIYPTQIKQINSIINIINNISTNIGGNIKITKWESEQNNLKISAITGSYKNIALLEKILKKYFLKTKAIKIKEQNNNNLINFLIMANN